MDQEQVDRLQHAWLAERCDGRKALNLGCGMRPIPGAVNLDPNPERWAWADVAADAHRLPFGDGVFDVVVSNHVLPHFAHPEVALREMARVLRVGGKVAHVVPDLRYAPSRKDRRYPFAYQPHGWFGPDEFCSLTLRLADMLRTTELAVFDLFYWSFKYEAIRI